MGRYESSLPVRDDTSVTARSGSYCFFHDPESAHDRKLASRRGGQNHVALIPRDDVRVMPLRNAEKILTLIETTIMEVRSGAIPPQVANAIGYLANIRIHGLPMESVPELIEDESGERVREILMRVVEDSIEKSKAYGIPLPDELKPVAKAVEEYEKGGNRT
jgi:hypothetical protein